MSVWAGLGREEERYWHLQNVGDLLPPARYDAVGALLVFLHLLEGETEPIGQLLRLIASIMRRMRTRLPTCLSMALFAAVE